MEAKRHARLRRLSGPRFEAVGLLGWSVGVIGNSIFVVSRSDGAIGRRRVWPDDRFSMACTKKETRTSQLAASG
jgi:hypothetical protein